MARTRATTAIGEGEAAHILVLRSPLGAGAMLEDELENGAKESHQREIMIRVCPSTQPWILDKSRFFMSLL